MKKFIVMFLILISVFWLASCSDSNVPLTESEQAQKYNMTVGEYKEMKDAAARMNMTIEEHMKMIDTSWGMEHSMMDMRDDSHMIEDDSEMNHSWEDHKEWDSHTVHE